MTRLALFLLAAALPLFAVDFAVLHTGARLRAERIEKTDERYILISAGGRIELPINLVESVEHVDDPVPVAPPQPVVAQSAVARETDPRKLVTEAALRHGLPPAIVHALAMTESAYQIDALSNKGAIGVMQLMPGTALTLNADPRDVEQNIDAGTRLLRDLLVKYENDPNPVRRALAAYNAGSGAVARYNGVPPYRETQAYVEKVIERYWKQVNAQSPGSLSVQGSAAPTPAP